MAKFRKLKTQNFVILSYWSEFAFTHIDGELKRHDKWEYDNGLYITDGWDSERSSWKELKELLNPRDKLRIFIDTGHCHRCGCKLTSQNYKNEIEDELSCCIEPDFFYCNKCKEQKYIDFAKFMLEDYENEDEE